MPDKGQKETKSSRDTVVVRNDSQGKPSPAQDRAIKQPPKPQPTPPPTKKKN